MDLLEKLYQRLTRLQRPALPHSFALFRVLFFAHVLSTVYYTNVYKALVFDSIAGVSKSIFPFNLFITLWFVSALMVLIGFRTRLFAAINYVLTVISADIFLRLGIASFYHDMMKIGGLFCLFFPVSKTGSVDALLHRIRYIDTSAKRTNYLNYLFFVGASLGLLYFGSSLTKIYSPMWQHGIGIWLPLNVPQLKWNTLYTWVIDQQYLLLFANYTTMIWEFCFLFLLFIPRAHKFIIIPGILFHIGIGTFLYLPQASIGPILFYSLLIPDSFWYWVQNRIRSKSSIAVYIPEHNLFYQRIWAAVYSLDFRNRYVQVNDADQSQVILNSKSSLIRLLKHSTFTKPLALLLQLTFAGNLFKWGFELIGKQSSLPFPSLVHSDVRQRIFYYFFIHLFLVQLFFNYIHFKNFIRTRQNHIKETNHVKFSEQGFKWQLTSIYRTFLGVNAKGVFLDRAIYGMNTVYAITYVDSTGHCQWLPYTNVYGHSHSDLNRDKEWTKLCNHYIIGKDSAKAEGVNKLIRFWANNNHIKLENNTFRILKRNYSYPGTFVPGYWRTLEAQPWTSDGFARWTNGKYSYERSRQIN